VKEKNSASGSRVGRLLTCTTSLQGDENENRWLGELSDILLHEKVAGTGSREGLRKEAVFSHQEIVSPPLRPLLLLLLLTFTCSPKVHKWCIQLTIVAVGPSQSRQIGL